MKFKVRGKEDPQEMPMEVYASTYIDKTEAHFCVAPPEDKSSFIICEIDSEGYVKLNLVEIAQAGLKIRVQKENS